MKINAIGAMTFGSKQQVAKKAAGFTAAAMTGLAADTFVKGLSKPDKAVEDQIIRANDEGSNPFDICCSSEPAVIDQAREDWCCE